MDYSEGPECYGHISCSHECDVTIGTITRARHSRLLFLLPSSSLYSHTLTYHLALFKTFLTKMHILNLEAMGAILPLLYFFCPSGLDDVSRPIQELALTPYVISEAQRGVVYGITSYASLPPVAAVFRTLFPTGGPVLALDPPKPKLENQHPEQTPCGTHTLQAAHHAPIVSTRSPCVNLHVMTSKPLVQPTCSRLDAPDLANVSRVLLDMPITHDFSYSLSAGLLAWGAIWTLTAVSVLLMFQKFVSVVCCIYSGDSSAATVCFWFYILFDFALCWILDNFQLGAVLLPLWQGFVSGGIIVGTLCSLCRMVRNWTVGPILSRHVDTTFTGLVPLATYNVRR
jgi:hypothetical protein